MAEIVKKNDFVELKYTGYAQGIIFDSNNAEDLRQIHPEAQPKQTIIVVGQGMLVAGLDKEIEGKEIGKEYQVKISAKDGFGVRQRELMKTIPLKVFTERNISPRAGMTLALDDVIVRIIAVSGARVITDFNNPLAGKELEYKFTIIRKVTDEKERVSALFEVLFKFVPEFEVREKEIVVKGDKQIEIFVNAFKEKFKELMGKDLVFEEKKSEESTSP